MKDIFQKTQVVVYKETSNTLLSLLENHHVIIDLGGGDGTLSKSFLTKAKRVVVTDINKFSLQKAKKIGLETTLCDLNKKLPFKNNYADAFVLSQTIEHVVNVDLLISEIWRCLKPHGKVYIATPNLAAWHNRVLLLMGKLPHCCSVSDIFAVGSIKKGFSPQHFRIFTFESLKSLFELYGFKTITMKGSGYYPPNFLGKIFSKIIPSSSVNIVAKFEKTKKPSFAKIAKTLNLTKTQVKEGINYMKKECKKVYPIAK